MAKCNTQTNDVATKTNNWETPGASNPGRYIVVLVFFGLAFLVKIIVGVRAKRRSVWGRALELALQVGPQLRKPTIGKPPPRPPRNG